MPDATPIRPLSPTSPHEGPASPHLDGVPVGRRWAFDAEPPPAPVGTQRWTFDEDADPPRPDAPEPDSVPVPAAQETPDSAPAPGFWASVRRLFGGSPPTVAAEPEASVPAPPGPASEALPVPRPEPQPVPPAPQLAAPAPLAAAGGPAADPGGDAVWITRPPAADALVTAQPNPSLPTVQAHHVLLAEADPTTARVLQHRLERDGLEVTVAQDVAAARAALTEGGVDLLLLDADLPGGAFDVLRRLRRGHGDAELPVILLTWPGNDLFAVRAFGVGSDDVVTRPFSLAEVVARVKYQLQRRAEDRLSARIAERVEQRLTGRIEAGLAGHLSDDFTDRLAERVADRLRNEPEDHL